MTKKKKELYNYTGTENEEGTAVAFLVSRKVRTCLALVTLTLSI